MKPHSRLILPWFCIALVLGMALGLAAAWGYARLNGGMLFAAVPKATEIPVLEIATVPSPTSDSPTAAPLAAASSTPPPISLPQDVPVAQAVDLSAVTSIPLGDSRTVSFQRGAQRASFELTVQEALSPNWYQTQYGSMYRLTGTEAGCTLTMVNRGTTPQSPEDWLTLSFVNAEGQVIEGYPLMDQPIGGAYGSTLAPGEEKQFTKRYVQGQAQGKALFLMATWSNGDSTERVFFSLQREYQPLRPGDTGDDVLALQQALLRFGYLSGKADGIYGDTTADAVKYAQAALGFAETGIASAELQKKLLD